MDNRLKILDQPSYWVEKINTTLYNAILDFMEENEMKQKDLAEHLGISRSRVSQILNDGDVNFSLEKIVQIALKVGVYPNFKFESKEVLLERKESNKRGIVLNYDFQSITHPTEVEELSSEVESIKVISIGSSLESNIAL